METNRLEQLLQRKVLEPPLNVARLLSEAGDDILRRQSLIYKLAQVDTKLLIELCILLSNTHNIRRVLLTDVNFNKISIHGNIVPSNSSTIEWKNPLILYNDKEWCLETPITLGTGYIILSAAQHAFFSTLTIRCHNLRWNVMLDVKDKRMEVTTTYDGPEKRVDSLLYIILEEQPLGYIIKPKVISYM